MGECAVDATAIVAAVGECFGRVDADKFATGVYLAALEPVAECACERTSLYAPEVGGGDFRYFELAGRAHR